MKFVAQRNRASKRPGAWREVVTTQSEEGIAAMTAQILLVAANVGIAAAPLTKEEEVGADDSSSAADVVSTEPSEGSGAESDRGWSTKELPFDACSSDNESSRSSERGKSDDSHSSKSRSSPWLSPSECKKSATWLPERVDAFLPIFTTVSPPAAATSPENGFVAIPFARGELNSHEYSVSDLLKYRHCAAKDACDGEWLVCGILRCEPAAHNKRVSTTSAPAQAQRAAASAVSWGALQRKRRCVSEEVLEVRSDSEVRRFVSSILNKLTPEKFETLYGKLLESGICTWTHVEDLAQGIFEKATVQTPFSSMYADLCLRLLADLCDGACWFRHVLLSRCWANFESTFQSPTDEADISSAPSGTDSEEDVEAKSLHKRRALGNVRFMGELLIRGLLFPEDMFACTEALLRSPPSPGCLEALAILLRVVGPYYDDAKWSHHSQLRVVFWHIGGILLDQSVPKRVRFLLKDVMDLREAGWVDMKLATQVDQPQRLEEIRKPCSCVNVG